VTVYNAASHSAVIVEGTAGTPIEDVTLSDIRVWYKGGGTAAQAARVPPEDTKGYPEPDTLGTLPAYGFYLRHVQGIVFSNIQTRTLTTDLRPAFSLDDVSGARFSEVDAAHASSVPIFSLKNVTDLGLHQVQDLKDRQH
jgi:hypothetical protein